MSHTQCCNVPITNQYANRKGNQSDIDPLSGIRILSFCTRISKLEFPKFRADSGESKYLAQNPIGQDYRSAQVASVESQN